MPSGVAPLDPDDVEAWTEFRRRYGLRRDLDWLRAVAADPRSTSEFPLPLMPAEVASVVQHDVAASGLAPALEGYGRGFDEFAGVVVDGPMIEIRFTTGVEEHRALLDAMFPGSDRIRVEGASYSLSRLEALAGEVEAERDRFPSFGAELFRADAMILANKVRVRYIAPDPTIESDLRAHFGRPDWLDLEWYRPPAWEGPVGDLTVRAVWPDGRPATADCMVVSVEQGIFDHALPLAADPAGECTYAGLPAVRMIVSIEYVRDDGERGTTKRRATIPAGERLVLVLPIED